MTYYDFDELVGDLTPEQRARVEALKEEARAEIAAYNLKETAPCTAISPRPSWLGALTAPRRPCRPWRPSPTTWCRICGWRSKAWAATSM